MNPSQCTIFEYHVVCSNPLLTYGVFFRQGEQNSRSVGIFHTRGMTPRHFQFDPSGQWLIAANQDTDRVGVFQFNVHWLQLVKYRYSYFHLDFVEGQSIKISSKYQHLGSIDPDSCDQGAICQHSECCRNSANYGQITPEFRCCAKRRKARCTA